MNQAAKVQEAKGPLVWLDMDQKALDDAYDQMVYAPNRDQVHKRNMFNSDRVRARLGAPKRLANHAAAAVSAAQAIANAVEAEFRGSLSVGIGVHTGTVVAGNVGGAGRFEFSVIGDPVNVAARIESTTRQTGDTILISGRTLDLLDDGTVQVEERPDVVLKGKSGAVSLFAVQP